MEILSNIVQVVYTAISVLGAMVVIYGVMEAIISFLMLKVSKEKKNHISENEAIRQRLGAHLLLGLEIFIAADIISSVVSPSWDKVGILAAIVAIRTVLSYFLRMEVKQTQV
jgi:uncharacterized membrane protein